MNMIYKLSISLSIGFGATTFSNNLDMAPGFRQEWDDGAPLDVSHFTENAEEYWRFLVSGRNMTTWDCDASVLHD